LSLPLSLLKCRRLCVLFANCWRAPFVPVHTCITRSYAARAKKIVNVAEMNEVDNLESFMDNYWNEVDALRRQVAEAKDFGAAKVDEAKRHKEEVERKAAAEKDRVFEEAAASMRTVEGERDALAAELAALKGAAGKQVKRETQSGVRVWHVTVRAAPAVVSAWPRWPPFCRVAAHRWTSSHCVRCVCCDARPTRMLLVRGCVLLGERPRG